MNPPDHPTYDETIIIGLTQITIASAWWYRGYVGDKLPEHREHYGLTVLEDRAQQGRIVEGQGSSVAVGLQECILRRGGVIGQVYDEKDMIVI